MEMEELQVEVVMRPAHSSSHLMYPELCTSVATHSTLRSPPRSYIPSAEPPRVEHSELMMTVILGDTRGV